MANMENVMVNLALLLIIINGLFIFTASLPGDTSNNTTLNIGIDAAQQTSLLNKLVDINNKSSIISGVAGDPVSVSGDQKSYLTLLVEWLFGSLQLVNTIFNFFASMFFGYWIWIDLFLPSVIPAMVYLQLMIKSFLTIITILGIFQYALTIFTSGTGAR